MYEIGYVIIFCVGLLEKLTWLITDLLRELIREVLPRYHAKCFFKAVNELYIPGETDWNFQVVEILMSDYGYI